MIFRKEHPNPQFFREDWRNLNGEWQFEIDNSNTGKERQLFNKAELSDKINVPFCPESELSGIGNKDFMLCVWYKKKIKIDDKYKGKRVLLHIGACDYTAEVWVNGRFIGDHFGGYASFYFDITKYLIDGENDISIRAYDVEQEQNGLFTYDRKPKFNSDDIKKIVTDIAACENE